MAKNSLYLIKLKRKSHSEFRHGTSLLSAKNRYYDELSKAYYYLSEQ